MRKASHVSKKRTASRTAGVYTTLSLNITPLFDVMNIAVGEKYERQPLGVPHCDCHASNEAFFKKKIHKQANGNKDAAYTMVPTLVGPDDTCGYCGHYTMKKPPMSVEEVEKMKAAFANRTKRVAQGAFTVRGTNTQTGEVVEFPSMQHAYYAGYGSVRHALEKNRVVKNWKWERVNDEK